MFSTFSLISSPVGVQILITTHKKYLFRSIFTKKSSDLFRGFFIQSVGCMELPQAYGITRQRAFLLRIDAIHHFVMIPYRNKLRISYAPSADFGEGFDFAYWHSKKCKKDLPVIVYTQIGLHFLSVLPSK